MVIKLRPTTSLKKLAEQAVGQPSSLPMPPNMPLGTIPDDVMQPLTLAREAFQIDNFNEAESYYLRAAEIAKINSTAKMACHYELAQVYVYKARTFLRQYTASRNNNSQFFSQPGAQQHLRKHYQNAVNNFNQALRIAEALNNQRQKIRILKGIAKSHASIFGPLTALRHWSAVFFAIQGKANKTAKRVEQQEVGFSSSNPIGTEQIQQCVVIVARDPATKRTGVAHVDSDTDPNSLEDVLSSKLVRGDLSKRIEVRLIGGFLERKSFILDLLKRKNFSFDLAQREIDKQAVSHQDKNAFRNIKVVLNALISLVQKGYNIEILSSDLAQSVEERPTAIVVNPQDGLLKAESPTNFHPDKWIRSGTLVAGSCPLRIAFDDDVHYPIRLCSDQIATLWNKYNAVCARGELDLLGTIYQSMKTQHPQASEDWLAVCINSQYAQAKAFFDANHQIMQWCARSGHRHDPLQLKQIYLGVDSEKLNKKLIQEKDLYLETYDNEEIYNIMFSVGEGLAHSSSAMSP